MIYHKILYSSRTLRSNFSIRYSTCLAESPNLSKIRFNSIYGTIDTWLKFKVLLPTESVQFEAVQV